MHILDLNPLRGVLSRSLSKPIELHADVINQWPAIIAIKNRKTKLSRNQGFAINLIISCRQPTCNEYGLRSGFRCTDADTMTAQIR